MPFGKDLDDEEFEDGQEEMKEETSALVPMNRSERMKKSMRRGGARDVPSHFAGSDSEDDEAEDDGEELGDAPKYTQSDAKEKTSLTSFIMQEAQIDASRDPKQAKHEADVFKKNLMLQMLSEGIPLKILTTKYLVPQSALGTGVFTGEMDLESRKAAVTGKMYLVEVYRVLYLLHDMKTIAFRGPVNENEGFASPFCRTRSTVDSYQLSHMYKPFIHAEKRYIRLRFKAPPEAKVQYKPRHLDIMAKDDDEFELLQKGFYLVWMHHCRELKLDERDPKKLMKKAVKRPKTMEEKWEQQGYQPFVFQTLDPDNNIRSIHIGLGRSKEDLLLIGSAMTAFWSLLLMLFGILMKASLDQDETNFALWSYFYFLCFFVGAVVLAVILSKTNVEELGLTSTKYDIDPKGNKTVHKAKAVPSRTWGQMFHGWALKLGDWFMFGIVELTFGGLAALFWIVFMDNMYLPAYYFVKRDGPKQLWKQTVKPGAQRIGRRAVEQKDWARKKTEDGWKKTKLLPGKTYDTMKRKKELWTKSITKHTVSKREQRKRQTQNIGVGALHKEERRERRTRGSAAAEVEMNRRKSRRRDSSTPFHSKADSKYMREVSRSPVPVPGEEAPMELEIVPGQREVATL